MFARATQCMWGVLDPSVSTFSLSLYRHPFIYTLFSSRFTLITNNNNPVPERRVDSSTLVFSLSSHRHSELRSAMTKRWKKKHYIVQRLQQMWTYVAFVNTWYSRVTVVVLRCGSIFFRGIFFFTKYVSLNNPVSKRRVDSSVLVFSLSSHRHSELGFTFDSHCIVL
jgi:hypothetical protein